MAKRRITEEFVSHLKVLRERTGNSPHNVTRALDKHPELATSIRELRTMWYAIENHRRNSQRRFIVQTHPEFPAAVKDYESHWSTVWVAMEDWEDRRAGRETFIESLERMAKEKTLRDTTTSQPIDQDDDWDFDPDEYSAAELIAAVRDACEWRAEDEPFWSRAKGAFDWLVDTVGIDLSTMEARFKEFPVLIIPKHVSDKHGISDPRSLFAYLTDIRRAYVAGADLAAIAMCRACTEILMRVHYNQNSNTDLTPLIKGTQNKREFNHLKQHNLVDKVDYANKLMHFNKPDIGTANSSTVVIREWVRALQDMISRTPNRS